MDGTTPAPDSTALAADLPDRRCGYCGYLLTGLSGTGRCPECGNAFDAREIVLFGWGLNRRSDAVHVKSPAKSLALFFLATFWLWFQPLLGMFVGGFLWPRWMYWLYLTMFVVYAAFYLFRRTSIQRSDHGSVQLRMSPWGFGHCMGYGSPKKMRLWTDDYSIDLKATRRQSWRLLIKHRRAWVGIYPNIDFEFEATQEQADALLRKMIAWRDAAAQLTSTSTGGAAGAAKS